MVDGTRSTESSFDTQKAEAFAGRLLAALNDGALCLMASIGHRTGLFDTMRDLPPQTSNELASRAGLNERYVREWLGAMVTSGVVTVDPQSVRYQLPPEHAAYLTRSAAANNFAARVAREEASGKGLKNVEFVAVDLSDFDRTAEPESFDFRHDVRCCA
jgi:hypothetical protein